MDEPARKRRKMTSPLPLASADRQSSPLRKPPRRPSFASPTKSSLARNYPGLLPSGILSRGKQARAYVLGEAGAQEASGEKRAETTAGAQKRYREAQNVTPRMKRAVDGEEPELPATPSQQGLEEQDTPRRGALFSSPSKRPPRLKDPVKQSPLRPKAPPVQAASSTQHVEGGPGELDRRDGPIEYQPPDVELEKKKQEKARLEREVAELEAQVTRCAQEIAKEEQRSPGDALRTSERADLHAFIASISGADSDGATPPPISSLLRSFLPFSAMTIPPPRPNTIDRPVPSHRPIELADPLPYLEMFTTMKYTTQLALPRGRFSPASSRVHQRHVIDITGPQKLLTAQISVTIDTLANQIIDMHVLHLAPWADRDLGAFLRDRTQERDLSNACWAIDSYWTIAQKRALYWHRCETTFSHLLPGRDQENTRPRVTPKSNVSRKELYRHLGRDSIVLQDSHVLLKINWRIAFDWTGEAESRVAVEPAFPSVWTEGDARRTFDKVPETFAALVQRMGVFGGTRALVGLLFGSAR